MRGIIQIEFNADKGQILGITMNAPLNSQDEKELVIKVLAACMPIALDFHETSIIKPNGLSKLPTGPIVPKVN